MALDPKQYYPTYDIANIKDYTDFSQVRNLIENIYNENRNQSLYYKYNSFLSYVNENGLLRVKKILFLPNPYAEIPEYSIYPSVAVCYFDEPAFIVFINQFENYQMSLTPKEITLLNKAFYNPDWIEPQDLRKKDTFFFCFSQLPPD